MDKYEKVKDKLICLDQIWMRVEELMKKQRISQVDMVRLCQRKGYSIQQPEISKLKSGKCKITLYQLMAFADVLEVGTDYLINGSVNENTVCPKVFTTGTPLTYSTASADIVSSAF